MRIISGTHRGRVIEPPRNLRARPTTDFAKENLFNVLGNMVDFEGLRVLDLFAGTGSISYEFASRGAAEVTAVEINAVHYNYIRRTAAEFGFAALHAVKANVFLYLKSLTRQFDLVFADAPYDLAGADAVIDMVLGNNDVATKDNTAISPSGNDAAGKFGRDLVASKLTPGGLLVFEHGRSGAEHGRGADFTAHPRFVQQREYGSVVFSFFE